MFDFYLFSKTKKKMTEVLNNIPTTVNFATPPSLDTLFVFQTNSLQHFREDRDRWFVSYFADSNVNKQILTDSYFNPIRDSQGLYYLRWIERDQQGNFTERNFTKELRPCLLVQHSECMIVENVICSIYYYRHENNWYRVLINYDGRIVAWADWTAVQQKFVGQDWVEWHHNLPRNVKDEIARVFDLPSSNWVAGLPSLEYTFLEVMVHEFPADTVELSFRGRQEASSDSDSDDETQIAEQPRPATAEYVLNQISSSRAKAAAESFHDSFKQFCTLALKDSAHWNEAADNVLANRKMYLERLNKDWEDFYKLLKTKIVSCRVQARKQKAGVVTVPRKMKCLCFDFKQHMDGETKKPCGICLEEYLIEQQLSRLVCGHVFHYKCIQRNPSSKCPTCRQEYS